MTADAVPAVPKPKRGGSLRSLLLLALFAWALRSFVVAPFSIPSGSMLPTMVIGDYLFVAKWPYGYSRFSFPFQIPSFDGRVLGRYPKRGDIVIFRLPADEKQDWVKRVIGLPGDRISVQEGQLFLNGKPVPRAPAGDVAIPVSPNSACRIYPNGLTRLAQDAARKPTCLIPAFRETLPNGPTYLTLNDYNDSPGDNFPETMVPAGNLFVMGDNRDDSADSRFPAIPGPQGGVGFLPLDHLVGRATFRFWSTDGSASWLNPISWFTALRGGRIGKSYNQ